MSLLADLDPDVAYPATLPEMAESWLHTEVRIATYAALRGHFAGRPGCFVGSDFNVYYRPRPDSAFVVPDIFVSFGANPDAIERAASYRVWDSGAPRFVLEITSKRTHRRNREVKPAIYLEMGVEEYWRFDPTGEFDTPALQGHRRTSSAWAPIEVTPDGGRTLGRSRALGLDLHAEASRLRLRDPRTGLWLPDHNDARVERDAAEARATDAEAARRAAEDRAAAAEAELAALRRRMSDKDGDTPR
ncbi:MAG: Uma2 family endonuclease [Acidimicrobiia bacterium]|nr:Uma2 family endonuclease [Acidimicrobiia bacterium]